MGYACLHSGRQESAGGRLPRGNYTPLPVCVVSVGKRCTCTAPPTRRRCGEGSGRRGRWRPGPSTSPAVSRGSRRATWRRRCRRHSGFAGICRPYGQSWTALTVCAGGLPKLTPKTASWQDSGSSTRRRRPTSRHLRRCFQQLLAGYRTRSKHSNDEAQGVAGCLTRARVIAQSRQARWLPPQVRSGPGVLPKPSAGRTVGVVRSRWDSVHHPSGIGYRRSAGAMPPGRSAPYTAQSGT